jgi:hypothetical protein
MSSWPARHAMKNYGLPVLFFTGIHVTHLLEEEEDAI